MSYKTDKEEIIVSVHMISYNHEKYIAEAIEGVLMQKTTFPIELVISDDCSTDNTPNIIKKYSELYPTIIRSIIRDRNIGAIENFFDTFRYCKGKYIAICEGDDFWTEPLKIEKQVKFLELHKEYAGYAHQAMICIDGTEIGRFRENVPKEIFVNDIIGGRLFHTASVVFRREVIKSALNAPPVLSGDRLINFCIAFLGKIHFADDCMCVYRKHNYGLSSNATMKQMSLDLNSISFLQKLYPSFPIFRYKSYIYATIGLCKNGKFYQKLYYLFLSFFFSFSYFPKNIIVFTNNIRKRL